MQGLGFLFRVSIQGLGFLFRVYAFGFSVQGLGSNLLG